jgi:regulator of protease activity HflC (stomatin/prohibitin superfamily)
MVRDQFVYRQATRVCGIGLGIQLLLGTFLAIFGRVAGDSAITLASFYVLIGTLPWLALVVLFHQHSLERLEALENEELEQLRASGRSVFEGGREQTDVASRRLASMHRWLMPTVSAFVALALALLSYLTIDWLRQLDDSAATATPFGVGANLGWQLALCTALALGTFIFSRFVAGMSQQAAWANLRGGAGTSVGNAIVLLAIAVGIVFEVFRKPNVLEVVGYGIAVFAALVAAEILLNLILNIYRPRRREDAPRPAFDSKLLGLAAAPDSIVRSINEAVNYQFGFDITSSWGYQLLLRSIARLTVLAVVVLLLISMVVVVQPGEQAVRLRGGRIVGDVASGALLFKWPWPVESVERFDVGQVRSIVLGPAPLKNDKVNAWVIEGEPDANRPGFIVLSSGSGKSSGGVGNTESDGSPVAAQFALLDADLILSYRIRDGALLDFLGFTSDARSRRTPLDMRERALKAIALREVTQLFATLRVDEVLSPQGDSLVRRLKERIQRAFDSARSGVEVVGVQIPVLRPPAGEPAGRFEDLSIDLQNARKVVDEANRLVNTTMSTLAGSPEQARRIVAAIEVLREIERQQGRDAQPARAKRAEIEAMIVESRGQAASVISIAQARRWDMLMRARATASEVLGQAPSYRAAPALYRERAIMAVLTRALAEARVKYVLAVDPSRVDMDVQMEQPESGLNLGDYLEKQDK